MRMTMTYVTLIVDTIILKKQRLWHSGAMSLLREFEFEFELHLKLLSRNGLEQVFFRYQNEFNLAHIRLEAIFE